MGDNNFPSFEEFFYALRNEAYEPFPWQTKLADQIVGDGYWPTDIGVQTGLGKTTCLEIAVWALATQAVLPPDERTLQTRIWYVVNRRLLVDEATSIAEGLQKALRESTDGPVKEVADALRRLSAFEWGFGPLFVARFRGGAERGIRPPDPSCPSIILSTVPMFGSRLLFRGYGSSPGMRPVDTALAATDSLAILDEAHLARPLLTTIERARQMVQSVESVLPVERSFVQLVNLSATGKSDASVFRLGDDDYQNLCVQTRLDASKPVQLKASTTKAVKADLVETAIAFSASTASGAAPTVVVFTNTARRAAEVKVALDKQKKKLGFDVTLLTGRMRQIDGNRVRDKLLDGVESVRSGRPETVDGQRNQPTIVVATQTLEVGADLDFDYLVTESAGTRALIQRLGRLNRRGERAHAAGCIVHETDRKNQEWPVYGEEPSQVWDRLTSSATNGVVDASPRVIGDLFGTPTDEPPYTPELLPNHLWEWAKTRTPGVKFENPEAFTEVEPFISGIEKDTATVTVAWRAIDATSLNGRDQLDLVPAIHSDETVDLPIGEVFDAVKKSDAFLLSPDGRSIKPLEGRLFPGATVLFRSDAEPSHYGSEQGWRVGAKSTVEDVSWLLRGQTELSFENLVRFLSEETEQKALKRLLEPLEVYQKSVTTTRGSSEELEEPDLNELAAKIHDLLFVPLSALQDELQPKSADSKRLDLEQAWVISSINASDIYVLEFKFLDGRRFTSPLGDNLSTNMVYAQKLYPHLLDVGGRSESIAAHVGLPASLCDVIGLAGRVHDVGKADPRFQTLLNNTSGSELMAKSGRRSRSSSTYDSENDLDEEKAELDVWRAEGGGTWPEFGRHEMVSGWLFRKWYDHAPRPLPPQDFEVAMQLVLAHHGWARPLIPAAENAAVLVVEADILAESDVDGFRRDATKTVVNLAEWDLDQPTRFAGLHDRFGPWQLALLEAVVRQADHISSALGLNKDAAELSQMPEVI